MSEPENFDSIKELVVLWEIKNLYGKGNKKRVLDYVSTHSPIGHSNAEFFLKKLSTEGYFSLQSEKAEEVSVNEEELCVERHWKVIMRDDFDGKYQEYIRSFRINNPLGFEALQDKVSKIIDIERANFSKDYILLNAKIISEEQSGTDVFFVLFYLENKGTLRIDKIEDISKYPRGGRSKCYDFSFTVILLTKPSFNQESKLVFGDKCQQIFYPSQRKKIG